MIYFLHIPRTSGKQILEITDKSLNSLKSSLKNKYECRVVQADDPEQIPGQHKELFLSFTKKDELELFFNNLSKRNSILFLQGHFACTPFLYFDNLKTFSIIRSPLERVVSEYFYINYKYIDTIENKQDFINHLFCRINIQSTYLSSNIEWSSDKEKYCFKLPDTEQSFSKLLTSIKEKKIVLSTIKNRNFIIIDIQKELEKKINDSLNIPLTDLNTKTVNESIPLFELNTVLTKDIIEQFEKTNSLDYQLYNYVEFHENKYNRPLYPEDIKI